MGTWYASLRIYMVLRLAHFILSLFLGSQANSQGDRSASIRQVSVCSIFRVLAERTLSRLRLLGVSETEKRVIFREVLPSRNVYKGRVLCTGR